MHTTFQSGLRMAVLAGLAILGFAIDYAFKYDWSPHEPPVPIPGSAELATTGHVRSPCQIAIDDRRATWEIAFVTNRDLDNWPVETKRTVAGERTLLQQVHDALHDVGTAHFGFATVDVPFDRQRGACILPPGDNATPSTGNVSQQSAIHCRSLTPETESVFYSRVARCARDSVGRNVLVFVHGFNVSLDAAICRAAQMSQDMPFGGPLIAFSWPSVGETTGYGMDGEIAERSFWTLADLLANLRKSLPDDVRIHLLAHSMGNRVALRALNSLVGRMTPTGQGDVIHSLMTPDKPEFPNWRAWAAGRMTHPPLHHVVFAAPDVDADEFCRFIQPIGHVARDLTLYSSDFDVAMQASWHYNSQRYRAGDSRAKIEVDGLHHVRVTGTTALDPLGHSYYGSSPHVLNELSRLFHQDVNPAMVRMAEQRGVRFIRTSLRNPSGDSAPSLRQTSPR